MSSSKNKLNTKKLEKDTLQKELFRILNALWAERFAPGYTGPNQGATCENCSEYKSGDCRWAISPEECLDFTARKILLEKIHNFKQYVIKLSVDSGLVRK